MTAHASQRQEIGQCHHAHTMMDLVPIDLLFLKDGTYIEIFQLIKHIFYHNMFVCHVILIIFLAFPFPLHGVEPDVKAMLRCTTLAIT